MPPHWPRWVLTLGPLVLALMAAQLWLSGHLDLATALVLAATDMLPWFVALPGVLWLANRFPFEGPARWRNGVLHLAAGLLLSAALPVAALGLMRTNGDGGPDGRLRGLPPMAGMEMHPRPPPPDLGGNFDGPPPPRMDGPPLRPALWRMAAVRMPFHWLLYGLVLAAMHGWRVTQRGHERERRAVELERLLTEARLTGLSRQLHPHFLFNTLNTVVEFVRSNPERAEEMLIDLSELLRHALRAADRHVVPLAEELELLERYLAIQRARFGERLRTERRIAPQAMAAGVPVLLLQPLVENALQHGLDESDVPVTVTIEAALSGERLQLAVRDDAPGATGETAGEGIGLANIRERLTALYGADFRFEAGRRSGGGFSVDFVLPFQPGGVSSRHT